MSQDLHQHLPIPPTLTDVKKRREPIKNIRQEHEATLSAMDRLALFITERVGTMGFFFTILIWTAFWLGWNFLAPRNLQFDPPMAFVFWLFISNMIELLLMPLLMIGQNLQSRRADIRAENDYQVDLKAEREIEVILRHLEFQNAILITMIEKLGVSREEAAHMIEEHGMPANALLEQHNQT